MESGKWEQPPFAASGLIYGTVWCGDNMTYAEKIVFTIMQISPFAKYITGFISSLLAFK